MQQQKYKSIYDEAFAEEASSVCGDLVKDGWAMKKAESPGAMGFLQQLPFQDGLNGADASGVLKWTAS